MSIVYLQCMAKNVHTGETVTVRSGKLYYLGELAKEMDRWGGTLRTQGLDIVHGPDVDYAAEREEDRG